MLAMIRNIVNTGTDTEGGAAHSPGYDVCPGCKVEYNLAPRCSAFSPSSESSSKSWVDSEFASEIGILTKPIVPYEVKRRGRPRESEDTHPCKKRSAPTSE